MILFLLFSNIRKMTSGFNERWEWVEIIEPKTKETMFVNLASGDCVWQPPPHVNIKRMDKNQWWELYDTKTCRFYYYNAQNQKTVWQRPPNADIIPLAKLQILKQNTEVSLDFPKREISTQTAISPELTFIRRNTHYRGSSHRKKTRREQVIDGDGPESPLQSPKTRGCQPVLPMVVGPGPVIYKPTQSDFRVTTGTTGTEGAFQRCFSQQSVGSSLSSGGSGGGTLPHKHRAPLSPTPASDAIYDQPPPPVPLTVAPPPTNGHHPYHMMTSETSVDSGLPPDSAESWDSVLEASGGHHPLFLGSSSPASGLGFASIGRGHYANHQQHLHHQHSQPHSQPAHLASFRERSATLGPSSSSTSVVTPGTRQRNFPRTNPTYMRPPPPKRESGRSTPVYASPQSPSISDSCSTVSPNSASTTLSNGDSSSNVLAPPQHTTAPQDLDTPTAAPGTPQEPPASRLSERYSLSSTGTESSATSVVNQPAQQSRPTSPQTEDPPLPAPPPAYTTKTGLKTRERELIRQTRTGDHQLVPMAAPSSPSLSTASSVSLTNDRPQSMLLHSSVTSSMTHHEHSGSDDLSAVATGSAQHSHSSSTSSAHNAPPARSLSTGGFAGNQGNGGGATSLSVAARVAAGGDLNHPAAFPGWSRTLFRKDVPLSKLLVWSKESLQKSLLTATEKSLKKQACDVFKTMEPTDVQMYMGDRKAKLSLPDLALSVAQRGWAMNNLRDEVYMQLCKQTTNNPDIKSLNRGWELLCICLHFFPPSPDFQPYLEGYILRHLDSPVLPTSTPLGSSCPSTPASRSQTPLPGPGYNGTVSSMGQLLPPDEGFETSGGGSEEGTGQEMMARQSRVSLRRLRKILQSGARRGTNCLTADEVKLAKSSIMCPGLFGSTLEEVMVLQKTLFKDRVLPWIQVVLSEEVLRLNGAHTEGIFRVPGDIDLVNSLKVHTEKWEDPGTCPPSFSSSLQHQPPSPTSDTTSSITTDPHVPASLLKLWYRELAEPLIPDALYSSCLAVFDDPVQASQIVENLPPLNRNCLKYLVRFLQVFAAEESSSVTKMDVNNLAMVMAPNVLRSTSTDPHVIFNNTRPQMAFLRTLILHLDTTDMEGIR